MGGIRNMRNNKTNFDIDSFNSLPDNLKNNDYIDMLLFLIHLKPNVRLGKNHVTAYNNMKKWCRTNGYKYIISSSGYMYISRLFISAKITQIVDDSMWKHSDLLGTYLATRNVVEGKSKRLANRILMNMKGDYAQMDLKNHTT